MNRTGGARWPTPIAIARPGDPALSHPSSFSPRLLAGHRATLLAACASIGLAGTNASAAEVQFVAPGIAGSVTGVVVGGQTYDVTFEGRLTHQQWATQLDFTNEDAAEEAAQALAAALNAGGATAVRHQLTSGTFDHTGAVTWYATNTTSILGEDTIRSGGTWILANPLPGGSTAPLNTSRPLAADWTLAAPPAPVPTALPIAQIGLLGGLVATGIAFVRRAYGKDHRC